MSATVMESQQDGQGEAEQVPEPEQQQGYECDQCGRVFETAQGLGRHKAAAHGAKPTRRRKSERGARRAAGDKTSTLNTAALLKIVFPSGQVPVSKLDAVADWIVEARKLHG